MVVGHAHIFLIFFPLFYILFFFLPFCIFFFPLTYFFFLNSFFFILLSLWPPWLGLGLGLGLGLLGFGLGLGLGLFCLCVFLISSHFSHWGCGSAIFVIEFFFWKIAPIVMGHSCPIFLIFFPLFYILCSPLLLHSSILLPSFLFHSSSSFFTPFSSFSFPPSSSFFLLLSSFVTLLYSS